VRRLPVLDFRKDHRQQPLEDFLLLAGRTGHRQRERERERPGLQPLERLGRRTNHPRQLLERRPVHQTDRSLRVLRGLRRPDCRTDLHLLDQKADWLARQVRRTDHQRLAHLVFLPERSDCQTDRRLLELAVLELARREFQMGHCPLERLVSPLVRPVCRIGHRQPVLLQVDLLAYQMALWLAYQMDHWQVQSAQQSVGSAVLHSKKVN